MSHASYPRALRRLINELSRLPSIGEKTAARLAQHLLSHQSERARQLADALRDAAESVRFCDECFFFSDSERCPICQDPKRDRSVICVVEKPADIIAIERCAGFVGVYHVLHGLWSPLRGVGPEKTRLPELLKRVRAGQESDDALRPKVHEIILATGMTVEGDATALFISREVESYGVRVTRIAQGLPKGGELEYADELTLTHAFEGRRNL